MRGVILSGSARLRRSAAFVGTLCMAALVGPTATAATLEPQDRPKMDLRITPPMGVVPLRIVATAELRGGADDYFDFYCPRVSWDWDDGTRSETTDDCVPYEPGKSQIRRRFARQHTFHDPGQFHVRFVLKQGTRIVGSVAVRIDVHGR